MSTPGKNEQRPPVQRSRRFLFSSSAPNYISTITKAFSRAYVCHTLGDPHSQGTTDSFSDRCVWIHFLKSGNIFFETGQDKFYITVDEWGLYIHERPVEDYTYEYVPLSFQNYTAKSLFGNRVLIVQRGVAQGTSPPHARAQPLPESAGFLPLDASIRDTVAAAAAVNQASEDVARRMLREGTVSVETLLENGFTHAQIRWLKKDKVEEKKKGNKKVKEPKERGKGSLQTPDGTGKAPMRGKDPSPPTPKDDAAPDLKDLNGQPQDSIFNSPNTADTTKVLPPRPGSTSDFGCFGPLGSFENSSRPEDGVTEAVVHPTLDTPMAWGGPSVPPGSDKRFISGLQTLATRSVASSVAPSHAGDEDSQASDNESLSSASKLNLAQKSRRSSTHNLSHQRIDHGGHDSLAPRVGKTTLNAEERAYSDEQLEEMLTWTYDKLPPYEYISPAKKSSIAYTPGTISTSYSLREDIKTSVHKYKHDESRFMFRNPSVGTPALLYYVETEGVYQLVAADF